MNNTIITFKAFFFNLADLSNEILNIKIKTNAVAAIVYNTELLRARAPIRYAAKTTIAVTAGFMP